MLYTLFCTLIFSLGDTSFFKKQFYLFIYQLLGFCCYEGFSFLFFVLHFIALCKYCIFFYTLSLVASRCYSLVTVHRLLIAVASLFAEHRLHSTGLAVVACGIFLYQGSNMWLLLWQADSLPLH